MSSTPSPDPGRSSGPSRVPMGKGNLRYHWEPIRSAFRETVTERGGRELLDDTEEGTRQEDLDFYVLRHFCAS
jgi:hypothetical protein